MLPEVIPFYKRIFIYAKLRKSYVTNINLYIYISYIYIDLFQSKINKLINIYVN